MTKSNVDGRRNLVWWCLCFLFFGKNVYMFFSPAGSWIPAGYFFIDEFPIPCSEKRKPGFPENVISTLELIKGVVSLTPKWKCTCMQAMSQRQGRKHLTYRHLVSSHLKDQPLIKFGPQVFGPIYIYIVGLTQPKHGLIFKLKR